MGNRGASVKFTLDFPTRIFQATVYIILLILILSGCSSIDKKAIGKLHPNKAANDTKKPPRPQDMIVPGDKVEIHYYKNYQSHKDDFRFDIGDRLHVSVSADGELSQLEQESNSYIIKYGDTLMINYFRRYLSDSEEYRLDIGDKILITVHSHPEYSKEVVILPDGTISVLKVGLLKAKGLTVLELDKLLNKEYAGELISPDIDVFVLETESKLNSFFNRLFSNLQNTEGEISVSLDGTIDIPLIGAIKIVDNTLVDAKRIINEKYSEKLNGLEITLNVISGNRNFKSSKDNMVSRDVVVLPDGTISLDKIGTIKAKGLTIIELDDMLTESYKREYIDPEIDIIVVEVQKKLKEFLDLLAQNYVARSKIFLVNMDGNVNLPHIGDVWIAGMTIAEASKIVTEKYREKFPSLEVSLVLNESVRMTVAVMGEVRRPGVFQLAGRVSPLYALALAGGEMDTADLSNMLIMRGTWENPKKIFVDIEDDADMMTQNGVYVQAGDIVYVFKSGIANLDTFVDQYIRKLLPFNMGVGANYEMNKN
jgi:polysaccharide export outer membrane protein